MITLTQLRLSDRAKIVSIQLPQEVKERLCALGVSRGRTVRLLSHSLFLRNYLVESETCRIGLRRKTAEKIYVDEIESVVEGITTGKTGSSN